MIIDRSITYKSTLSVLNADKRMTFYTAMHIHDEALAFVALFYISQGKLLEIFVLKFIIYFV